MNFGFYAPSIKPTVHEAGMEINQFY